MRNFRFSFFSLLAFAVAGCSSSPELKTKSSTQEIKTVALAAVQFSRPDYEVADPDDYSNSSRALNCMPAQDLYRDFLAPDASAAILKCLNSLAENKIARYQYESKTNPYLELDSEAKDNPPCLAKTLPQIPLPREIYFLGKQEAEPLQCYSASFNTRAKKIQIEMHFPLARELKDARDLKIWFLTTVFSVLRDGQNEMVTKGSVVPETLCNQCFKNDANFEDKKREKIDPVLWP